MHLTCYRITEDNQLAEISFETLRVSWSRGEGCYWIDVEDFQTEELTDWLRSFNLSSAAMHVCTSPEETTRVIPLRQEVFFAFPVYEAGAPSNRVFLSFLCLKNLCITLHRKPIESLSRTARILSGDLDLTEATTSALVCTILVGLTAHNFDISGAAKTVLLGLEERMDHDPSTVELGDILDQGSAIRVLDGIVSEQVVCFDILRAVESPVLSLATNGYFQAVTSNSQYLDRVIDQLEKRVADLRIQYGSNQQDRTNQRLALLTVISAIFLPLTLIAGIYGMNFDSMPELHYRYGYPVTIGLMVILAGGLFWYFRHRGWFK